MYVQPLEGQLGPATLAPLETADDNLLSPAQGAPGQPFGPEDAISRFIPPWIGNGMLQNPMQTAMFGPLSGLLQQLMAMLQQMTGYQGSGGCDGYGGYGSEQFFSNATGSSTGDPHLAFNGNHWNSMVSQPDLLNSDSIPGGYQVSTQVTPPNARGITWNRSASVALDRGNTEITMNDNGEATVREGDRMIPLVMGQTVNLGNGATVTSNVNGSLTVLAQNQFGGRIATTLTAQGQGVNVETSAQNVDLGGSLVAGNQGPPVYGPISGQPPIDPWQPVIPSPVTGPTSGPIFAPPPPGGWNLPPPPLPPVRMTPY